MKPENPLPVDKTAALVVQSGTRAESITHRLSPEHQQSIAQVMGCLNNGFPNPKGIHDWRGFSYGSLHVVGFLCHGTRRSRHVWAVKCICGRYDVRKAETLSAMASGKTDARAACCYQRQQVRRWRKEIPQ